MLEQWLVVMTVLLGPQERHPAVFELATLIEAVNEVNFRLRAQTGAQQDMPTALVRLIQTELNESFRQVFASHLPVRWSHLNPLIRTLTTRHFRPDTVTMPVGFRLNMPTAPQTYRSAPPQKRAPAHQGGEEHTATSQVEVKNPNPLPHLQVRPGFRMRQSMEQSNLTTGFPCAQGAPLVRGERPVCVTAAAVGVAHTFEVVTQTKWAAVRCLGYW